MEQKLPTLDPQAVLDRYHDLDLSVDTLGRRTVENPYQGQIVEDNQRIVLPLDVREIDILVAEGQPIPAFERAGPRDFIYFDPSKVRSAILTAGGICPGLNDVIRALVMQLHYVYGAKSIYGIRYGLRGLIPKFRHDHVMLTPSLVEDIHTDGGTILGTSRGHQNIEEVVDALERMNVNILFMIGGDGTIRASIAIQEEVARRGLKMAVVVVPKTIDNDISYIQKSFGFETAFSVAVEAIETAHNEAEGAYNGIGLVQLMGRHSGHIASHAALAMREVNFVLIPEVDFDLEGDRGFLSALHRRILDRAHAVVVVAEGAGQKLLTEHQKEVQYDASGNVKLLNIGEFLKARILEYFEQRQTPVTLKYIDPSYMIRSAKANASDSVFAGLLAQNAVHAAMAGKTGIVVGRWGSYFTHLPARIAVSRRKMVDTEGIIWRSVLEATGQPKSFKND